MDQADVIVVGLGMRLEHLTPETEVAARSSRRVFYVSHIPGIRAVLESWCPDVTDLAAEFYRERKDRFESYKRMAARVLEAALETTPVMLALYGHPLILSHPTTLTLRNAPRLGLRVKVLPAVSSMDCLFADLRIDPLASGIQMHEATELLLYRRPLLPDMAALVWQVGLLETRLQTVNKQSRPERLLRFRDHLLRFYPPQHVVYSVATSVEPSSPAEIHRFPIADIPEHGPLLHPGTSLYIPPASVGTIIDQELLRSLTSESHLGMIVR